MAKKYLIDTSAVIKYINGSLPEAGLDLLDEILDRESIISFITQIELQVWTPVNYQDKQVYEQFISGSLIIGVDDEII